MWYHVNQLCAMLAIYNSMDIVGEILIINNDDTKTPELNFSKVRLIGSGKNIYVNKAWKLGVEESKFDNAVLVNDDITIKGDLNLLFENISYMLREGVIVGVGANCYSKKNVVFKIKLRKRSIENRTEMGYGFGVFMFINKDTFLNTPIPDNILVWYGDYILYYKNTAWSFEGVQIRTAMRGTTSKIDLRGFALKEKRAFFKYLSENK